MCARAQRCMPSHLTFLWTGRPQEDPAAALHAATATSLYELSAALDEAGWQDSVPQDEVGAGGGGRCASGRGGCGGRAGVEGGGACPGQGAGAGGRWGPVPGGTRRAGGPRVLRGL